jgi:hypothetical protein
MLHLPVIGKVWREGGVGGHRGRTPKVCINTYSHYFPSKNIFDFYKAVLIFFAQQIIRKIVKIDSACVITVITSS